MRGTNTKKIRHGAKQRAITWYRGLLSPEENEKATDAEILEYVVKADYVSVDGQVQVSENTLRKFVLQEKKDYAQATSNR